MSNIANDLVKILQNADAAAAAAAFRALDEIGAALAGLDRQER